MLPILYSFRRCPYAMRARWALLEAGLLVQWREIALKAKPSEMLAVSPKGTVPVLVLPDGSVIEESLAVMHWALDQADPRELRNAGDASALIEQNDGAFKHHLDRFKYTDRYPGTNKEEQRAAGLAILQNWNQRIADQGWLLGERCSLADAALWPFVRQWRIADPEGFDNNSLEALRHWDCGGETPPLPRRCRGSSQGSSPVSPGPQGRLAGRPGQRQLPHLHPGNELGAGGLHPLLLARAGAGDL